MRILLVDDSTTMRRIQRNTLEKLGYTDVTEADDGVQAVKAVAAAPFDLVLMDWNMPNMTGIEFLQNLREKGIAVPFGFVTTEVSPEMRAKAEACGSAFLIGKPFTPTDFVRALTAYLD